MGEVIQLSVAPVFLLVAIGSLLSVVTGRLGRVVDRARVLEEFLLVRDTTTRDSHAPRELRTLDRRMRYCHWSINFLSVAAMVVAILVATLFISDIAHADQAWVISALFVAAVVHVMIGIGCFIAEIYVATRTVRVRPELL